MSLSIRPLKYLLGWLIAGTRGGVTRAKIIKALKEIPLNANQLANLLEMDYRTIRHHLEVLQKNRIITSAGEGYGVTYFLSYEMEENYEMFEEFQLCFQFFIKKSFNFQILINKNLQINIKQLLFILYFCSKCFLFLIFNFAKTILFIGNSLIIFCKILIKNQHNFQ